MNGSDRRRQYKATLSYPSIVSEEEQSIIIDVGLREPNIEPVESLSARTILRDPLRNEEVIKAINVKALSVKEAYAEKFRAALTRRDRKIRDFYDIDHAITMGIIDVEDPSQLKLIRQKLEVPGNNSPDVSEHILALLKEQLDSELKAVLRDEDFRKFILERAFGVVKELADKI